MTNINDFTCNIGSAKRHKPYFFPNMKENKNKYRFDFDALHNALAGCSQAADVIRTLHNDIADAFAIIESNFFIFDDNKQLASQSIDISISLDNIVNHLEEEGITDWAIENAAPAVISDLFADNSANSSIILIPVASGRSFAGLFVARANRGKAATGRNRLAELDKAVKLAAIVYDKVNKYNDNRILNKRLTAVEQQILDNSKFISAGELAASIADEIKASLLILGGHIQFIESGVGNTKRRMEIIKQELNNIKSNNHRLAGLLDIAEADEEHCIVNICDIIDDILQITSRRLEKDNIIIEKSFIIDNDKVLGSRQLLGQAFLNIILSAGNHIIDGGTLQISVSSPDFDNLSINFSDMNPNPYSLNVGDIFEPFYSSENSKGKFSMGLYPAKMIIGRHGGKIFAISEEGRGRTIKIILPLYTD